MTSDAIDPYVPERGNRGYEVTGYDLDLEYAVSSNLLHGRARITAVALEQLPSLALDLAGLRVRKAEVNGRLARWRQRGAKLHVTPSAAVAAGEAFDIVVRYDGNPHPAPSTWGPVGWEELNDGVVVAAQPSGAPTWFPCNDLARQKAPIRIALTAASGYHVVANGELVARRVRGSRTRWVYDQVEPTSPYLATVHVGRYVEHDISTAPVPIRAVLSAAHRPAFDAAFANQTRMMDLFVGYFGAYPFDAGYTVVVTPDALELPLEAQGQSIFGTNHLDGHHERLIAHELAHQWFGNSLTAASWQDIWLHEGFACYAEWLWSEGSGGPTAHDRARQHHGHLRALPQDLVLADPGPADMFDDRVYKRGALTLHALRLAVGDDAFFHLLKGWTSSHQHSVVTTAEFEAIVRRTASRPVDDLLTAWLRQPALPALSAPG